MKSGKVERGWLGVQIQPVTQEIAESLGLAEAKGALVVSPQNGSPGAKAGIKQGDVITAVNGDPIKDARDLAKKVAAIGPNKKVDVSIWRGGKAQSVEVMLGNLASDEAAKADTKQSQQQAQPSTEKALASLGITVAPSDDGTGVSVTDVDPDSEAAAKGLKEGEKITAVNNQQVASANDISKAIAAARKDGRTRALFQIESQSGSRFIALPINEG